MHVALVMIESEAFRDLIHVVCPALDHFMVTSRNTIRRWIRTLFDEQALWTAPNQRAFVGVVVHWLDEELKKQDVQLGLRRLKGPHSGENIAEAVIPLLKTFDITENLGFFIADNASTNDTAINHILRAVRPDIKHPEARRVRCLGHIINLVAKAFLFSYDIESFETDQWTLWEASEYH